MQPLRQSAKTISAKAKPCAEVLKLSVKASDSFFLTSDTKYGTDFGRRPAFEDFARFGGYVKALAGFYEISCVFRGFATKVEWLRERPPRIRWR